MRPHHRALALLGLAACATPPPEQAPDTPRTDAPRPTSVFEVRAVYGPPATVDDLWPDGPTDTDVPDLPKERAPKEP